MQFFIFKLYLAIAIELNPNLLIPKEKPWHYFSIRVFFHRHWWFMGQQGERSDHLYSSQPLPPAHEHSLYSSQPLPPAHKHSDVYLQLCMWDVTTTYFWSHCLWIPNWYHLLELLFDWLMMECTKQYVHVYRSITLNILSQVLLHRNRFFRKHFMPRLDPSRARVQGAKFHYPLFV